MQHIYYFLVYHNFRSSSNFSTKAAIFNKVVLATNQFWIGRVTEKYDMGKTVDEGDVRQMVSALEQLNDQLTKERFNKLGYRDYLLTHCEESLELAFQQILE